MVKRGKRRHFREMSYATAMNKRHSYIIHQLLCKQSGIIIHGIKHFTNCNRCCGVFPYKPQSLLQFTCNRIFKPEEMKRLKVPGQSCRFDRCQPVMNIVKQVDVITKDLSCLFKYPLKKIDLVCFFKGLCKNQKPPSGLLFYLLAVIFVFLLLFSATMLLLSVRTSRIAVASIEIITMYS